METDPEDVHNLPIDPVHQDCLRSFPAELKVWQHMPHDPPIFRGGVALVGTNEHLRGRRCQTRLALNLRSLGTRTSPRSINLDSNANSIVELDPMTGVVTITYYSPCESGS